MSFVPLIRIYAVAKLTRISRLSEYAWCSHINPLKQIHFLLRKGILELFMAHREQVIMVLSVAKIEKAVWPGPKGHFSELGHIPCPYLALNRHLSYIITVKNFCQHCASMSWFSSFRDAHGLDWHYLFSWWDTELRIQPPHVYPPNLQVMRGQRDVV